MAAAEPLPEAIAADVPADGPVAIDEGPPPMGAPHEGGAATPPPTGAPRGDDSGTPPPMGAPHEGQLGSPAPPPQGGPTGDLPIAPGPVGADQAGSVLPAGQPGGPAVPGAPVAETTVAPPDGLDLPPTGPPTGPDGAPLPVPPGGDGPEPTIVEVPAPPPDGTVLVAEGTYDTLVAQAAYGRKARLEALLGDRSPGPRPTAVQTIVRAVAPAVAAAPAPAIDLSPPTPDPDLLDLDGVARMFDQLGVGTELIEDATIDDLQDALDAGRGVVIEVEGEDGEVRTWTITGIDREAGILYAYEPPDGDLVELPLDEVLDAWEEAGNDLLLVGDAPEEEEEEGASGLQRAGMAVLPITLGAGVLAGVRAWRGRQDAG